MGEAGKDGGSDWDGLTVGRGKEGRRVSGKWGGRRTREKAREQSKAESLEADRWTEGVAGVREGEQGEGTGQRGMREVVTVLGRNRQECESTQTGPEPRERRMDRVTRREGSSNTEARRSHTL